MTLLQMSVARRIFCGLEEISRRMSDWGEWGEAYRENLRGRFDPRDCG